MLRYHGHFNRDQFLLGPLNESLLKARETLNFEFVSWRREIFVSSAEQDLLILAFSLCLLHRGHNLDPDDSEVLFHLALNHALMRQVRINSKIIDCCVLWNGWFEQWGVSKEAWSMKHETCSQELPQKNRSFHSTIALWMVLPYRCSIAVLFPAL